MFKNIDAAIFDMDGTIVDSMWVWNKIDTEYLAKHNLDVPPSLNNDISHLSFNEVAIYFKNSFNLPYTLEEIKEHWNDMAYEAYCNNTLLLEACLKANGIYEYFDTITLTNEVKRGKDFPDVYLLTANKLGVSPDKCMVFEDLLPAIQGAKKAGMKVIGVYDEHSLEQHNDMKALADDFILDYISFSLAI